jgi:hypothetical protein
MWRNARDFRVWPFASFRCGAEFGPLSGAIADIDQAEPINPTHEYAYLDVPTIFRPSGVSPNWASNSAGAWLTSDTGAYRDQWPVLANT